MNIIQNCISYNNKSNGFYSNHHLTGDDWYNKTACSNKFNYCMVNQKSWNGAVDVDGYDHVLIDNVALKGVKGNFTQIDQLRCTIENNSFLPYDYAPSVDDFENTTDFQQMTGARKADGGLPDLTFLGLKKK